ncbi:hypothetical protein J2X48_000716 [Bosea sp. BE271]|uniref:hypothetical protein n=1 Tax=Bosea TaxID=85413 RepID=UPI0028573754|nr:MULTISPECIES: hypothetical protein [Bosea]MDR6826480.1 hypothetical protein [Bosea robiniae]MDR6893190.1 hypothetical protein [Bosea sp. BE109]MDR7137111.1 hypothetical protein [Bosea sp. BE168]MDR7173810.1 hypothetical protein [Bosea sp. BE271]
MATTWNPSDKTAGVTLSGGNNIATGSVNNDGVRATNPFTAKTYCEIKVGSADAAPGLGTLGYVFGSSNGNPAYALLDLGGGSVELYNLDTFAVVASWTGSLAANDVLGFAVDGTRLDVTQNNVARITNATIAAGTYYPLTLFAAAATSTLQADTTTYSPPSGYTIIGGGGGGSTYTLTADRGIYTQTGGVVDFPNLVSKAAYKGAANGTTTATIPSHVSGDLLIAFAFRDGSTTQPTLPAGWTSIRTQAGTTCCGRWAWKRAASSSETSGTWTNASALEIAVYSGVDRVGASASQAGTVATVTWPALSMEFGNSWVLASAGHRSVNTTLETPPTGLTFRDGRVDATAEAAAFDTDGLVTSFGSVARNVGGTASGWVAGSVELVPQWGGAAGAASYTLVADRGTFTYSGVAAGLRTARKLVSALGTYALTGQAAGLKRGLRIVSNQGSYSLTGNAAGVVAARKLAASQGSYSLTGIAATLTYTPAAAAYTLTADAGSYTLTGRAAGLIATRVLVASPGSFVLSGSQAALSTARRLTAQQGGYTLTGISAGFNGQRLLTAASGSYSVTGRAATLTYTPAVANYVLTAETGVYTVTGRDAGLRRSAGHLHGRLVRGRRVGRLDEEFYHQLEAQQARVEARAQALITREALPPRVDEILQRYSPQQAAAELAARRAEMATHAFLERRAEERRQAERQAAEIMAAIELQRIAQEREEEDAIEALLLAA